MSMPTFDHLPPSKRRRLVLRGLLRAVAIAVFLLVLYFMLPLDRQTNSAASVVLAIGAGLVVIAVIFVYEVRDILRSPYPRMQALQAAFVAVPLFVLMFAAAYFTMSASSGSNFSEPLSRIDALYFTVTVFATVGFGDITATSDSARILVVVQMISGLLFLGFGVRLLLGATQMSLERGSGEPSGPAGHSDGASTS
jgi:cell division protein FtsW (lipid II flippase)